LRTRKVDSNQYIGNMKVNNALKPHAHFNNLFAFWNSRSHMRQWLRRRKHWQVLHERS